MPADRVTKFFVYIHENGSVHLKRYNDPGDIEEMVQSDLVKNVYQVTEEQWHECQRKLTPEERLAFLLSDGKADVRRLENGTVRQLK